MSRWWPSGDRASFMYTFACRHLCTCGVHLMFPNPYVTYQYLYGYADAHTHPPSRLYVSSHARSWTGRKKGMHLCTYTAFSACKRHKDIPTKQSTNCWNAWCHHLTKRWNMMFNKIYQSMPCESIGGWCLHHHTCPSAAHVTITLSLLKGMALAWKTLLMWPDPYENMLPGLSCVPCKHDNQDGARMLNPWKWRKHESWHAWLEWRSESAQIRPKTYADKPVSDTDLLIITSRDQLPSRLSKVNAIHATWRKILGQSVRTRFVLCSAGESFSEHSFQFYEVSHERAEKKSHVQEIFLDFGGRPEPKGLLCLGTASKKEVFTHPNCRKAVQIQENQDTPEAHDCSAVSHSAKPSCQ